MQEDTYQPLVPPFPKEELDAHPENRCLFLISEWCRSVQRATLNRVETKIVAMSDNVDPQVIWVGVELTTPNRVPGLRVLCVEARIGSGFPARFENLLNAGCDDQSEADDQEIDDEASGREFLQALGRTQRFRATLRDLAAAAREEWRRSEVLALDVMRYDVTFHIVVREEWESRILPIEEGSTSVTPRPWTAARSRLPTIKSWVATIPQLGSAVTLHDGERVVVGRVVDIDHELGGMHEVALLVETCSTSDMATKDTVRLNVKDLKKAIEAESLAAAMPQVREVGEHVDASVKRVARRLASQIVNLKVSELRDETALADIMEERIRAALREEGVLGGT